MADQKRIAETLVVASLGHDPSRLNVSRAAALLEAQPRLARCFPEVACVAADVAVLDQLATADPGWIERPLGPSNASPLVYVCFSRLADCLPQGRERRLAAARSLLDQGADPNACLPSKDPSGARPTCLYGASGINADAGLTELLLQRGARADDQCTTWGPESLYHACELESPDCLRLLVRAQPRPEQLSYCLGRAIDLHATEHVQWLLEGGADPNFRVDRPDARSWLSKAITEYAPLALIRLLLKHGAQVDAADPDGLTPYRLAIRAGRPDVARVLISADARDDGEPRDRFLGACASGDSAGAKRLLENSPGLLTELTESDQARLATVQVDRRSAALRLMLDLGFDPTIAGSEGLTAMHVACWFGRDWALDLLLQSPVDLEQRNGYGGTALTTAAFGATHCHADPGGGTMHRSVSPERRIGFARVIRRLLDAGADTAPFGDQLWRLTDLLERCGDRDGHPRLPGLQVHPHVALAITLRKSCERHADWPADPTDLIAQINVVAQVLWDQQQRESSPTLEMVSRNYHAVLPLGSLDATRDLAARMDGFEDWADAQSRGADGLDLPFEQAADALSRGRLSELETQLWAVPSLATMRSGRGHRATLLHYLACNGIEIYRQTVPPNQVELCRVLIQHGADREATCKLYGGGSPSCTRQLLETSQHPLDAGTRESVLVALERKETNGTDNGDAV